MCALGSRQTLSCIETNVSWNISHVRMCLPAHKPFSVNSMKLKSAKSHFSTTPNYDSILVSLTQGPFKNALSWVKHLYMYSYLVIILKAPKAIFLEPWPELTPVLHCSALLKSLKFCSILLRCSCVSTEMVTRSVVKILVGCFSLVGTGPSLCVQNVWMFRLQVKQSSAGVLTHSHSPSPNVCISDWKTCIHASIGI